jgi:dephospho-CoA kinase
VVVLSHSRVFGMTGGIGSGKSEVGRLLELRGIPVERYDALAAELAAPGGDAHATIFQHFGTSDRAVLRQRVFSSDSDRNAMERILSPLIVRMGMSRLDAKLAELPGHFGVFEVASLFELHWEKYFAGVLTVTAPENVRIDRAVKRTPPVSRPVIEAIAHIQLAEEERNSRAQFRVPNSGTISELEFEVDQLCKKLFSLIQK